MKGLYCQAGVTDAKPKFVIQETSVPEVLDSHQVRIQVKACGLSPLDFELLSDVGIQRDLIPVGREVAGVILQVGDKVSFFQPDDEVVGILPLDFPFSGLCDVIDIDEQYLVQKPEKLSWVCVAGALRDGVRMAAGNTILVFDGASVCKTAISLLHLLALSVSSWLVTHGAKVLTTSLSAQNHTFLEQLRPSVELFQFDSGSSDLLSVVLEETGGLGVDVIVDSGVRLQEEESEETKLLPHKHDVISVLGVGGHWVTSHKDLQLDPPDSRLLFLRSASVSFLNHEVWTASAAQQGRYLHILKDIMEKMSAGVLRPQPEEPVPLYEATVAMEAVQSHQKAKAVVQL
ncbi:unnamed protein product, partial [Tetraodon nigroviridis]